jgi:folate-binding Fe-S cluster repair protein YgfZ
LSKGCYRGQEAVARVHNLGHAPRRLVLLHLDGSEETLPRYEDQVWFNGQAIGWIGSAAHHYELGPIATAVINRKAVPDGPVRVPTRHDYVNASVQDVVIP